LARSGVASTMAKKLQKVELSDKMREFARRRSRTGVSWLDVSALSLRCALQSALAEEVAVMFSPAAGGLGVCITVFQDGQRHKEYAMTGEELSLILEGVTDAFASSSEDIRVALANGKE